MLPLCPEPVYAVVSDMAFSSYRVVTLLLVMGSVGCQPEIGTACDLEAARSVVYDDEGNPLYEGQALMVQSCAGGGGFCHSASAVDRYGAPARMDFDMFSAERYETELTRIDSLHRFNSTRNRIYQMRREVYQSVTSGSMPPGAAGTTVYQDQYHRADGSNIPLVRTSEGLEILRNWLACGLPAVERTAAVEIACTTGDRCQCDAATSSCEPVGDIVPNGSVTTLEPTFNSIFTVLLSRTCGTSSCHGGSRPISGLDLSSADAAFADLMEPATSCASPSRPRVTPGNPDESELYLRLIASPNDCGGLMPPGRRVSAETAAAVATWITNGATR